ncbi:PH domain-containing protein [Candidatus Dojkabacteria bacterium]|nr:PH domain-containing protein [Candidatus Dojkabacteria bacterium]
MPTSSESSTRRKPGSFIAKISDAKQAGTLAAFAAFPDRVKFEGQDRGENIILLVRQHPAVLLEKLIIVMGGILLPMVIVLLVSASGIEITGKDVIFGIGVALMWTLMVISFGFLNLFMWFFTVNIVTTERIVDIDFSKLFSHNVSECQLEKIEDVSHTTAGIWAAFFDFGTVFVQTAGEKREFEFDNVPRPRDVQDTILDLLELKQTPS